jgi:hypothetical protein
MKLIFCSFLVITLLIGCKTAEQHFQKFQQKGGKITCVSDTIKVLDTLVFNGDTIYQWRDKLVVKEEIKYLTKWETKYLYKERKQEEKTERAREKQGGKTERTTVRKTEATKQKETKQKEKTERAKLRWWLWLGIGFVIAHLLRYAYLLVRIFTNIPLKR